MKIVNDKLSFEQGDTVVLEDGRYAKFDRFNYWDGSLAYVTIDGMEDLLWLSELDLDKTKALHGLE